MASTPITPLRSATYTAVCACCSQLCGDAGSAAGIDLLLGQQSLVAEHDFPSVYRAGHATAGMAAKIRNGAAFQSARAGVIDNRAGERVLAALLYGGGQLQQLVFRAAEHVDPDQCRPADGQCAGLVEDDRIKAMSALQCLRHP